MATPLPWQYNDGGRAAAGFKGDARDCGARAIAIAARLDYRAVYDDLNRLGKEMGATAGRSSARNGLANVVFSRYLQDVLMWAWVPTVGIGQRERTHLAVGELPAGRIIARCSKHWVAVLDGTVQDTHDSTRDGTRMVYGYWHD